MKIGNNVFIWLIARLAASIPIPLGILLGGSLADSIFEPLMQSGYFTFFNKILGNSEGSGMALMFIFTSISGYLNHEVCSLG